MGSGGGERPLAKVREEFSQSSLPKQVWYYYRDLLLKAK
jgi:hypothetical protein